MAFVLLWFVMTLGIGGYIEPMKVMPADMHCGLPGVVVGVRVDRAVNPQRAYWPDPGFEDLHCELDIAQRIAALPHGEYHLATTIVDKLYPFGVQPDRYIGHDPHTSDQWLRSAAAPGLPGLPTNFRIGDKQ